MDSRVAALAVGLAAVLTFFVTWPSNAEANRDGGAPITVRDFSPDASQFQGEGWRLEKHETESGAWEAVLLNETGETIHTFGGCGNNPQWLRFFRWTKNTGKGIDLLIVLRYAGGSHGNELLDVVDLRNEFRTLLATDDTFNFRSVQDLDGNGWPEVVGVTRRFSGVLELSHLESPFPTIVLAYTPGTGKYVCANQSFPKVLEETVALCKSAFDLHKPVKGVIPYEPGNLRVHQDQFGPLLRWVVERCYAGEREQAMSFMKACTTADAATHIKETIDNGLKADRYFQEMSGPRPKAK